ncbi:type I secretion system permease/ATPase [Vibrio sp. Of7-15]|uniref:peptidase domain-containing ABC transporter n=1 Tax=Vibrio sp. Of7-15 TaxID=2724879 RepID=UPI001EF37276|nr:type I secretion system permease/ATPase [Vibrio sp. Of7-15]MCG7497433.1 type I secretion system permease/ATPase [Vibrio sp. Of7-15]
MSEQTIDQATRMFFSLAWISNYFDNAITPDSLQYQHPSESFSCDRVQDIASALGLESQIVKINFSSLSTIMCPAMIQDTEDNWYVMLSADSSGIEILDAEGKQSKISASVLKGVSTGTIVSFNQQPEKDKRANSFSGMWFIRSFYRYKHSISQILLTAFVLQICILILPLFLQTIIDKVVVHRSETTLIMLTIGVCTIMCMETILELVKRYLLAHTTAKIDAELGTTLFDKLMVLPYRFYSERSVGQIIARMNEVEQVRIFLNGATLTALIDLMLSLSLLLVMMFYSPPLAAIVIGSVPLYILVCVFILPRLYKYYGKQFETNAESNGFLVETIAGIETVRSMAVEPQMRYRWQSILSRYVLSRFNVTWWINVGVEGVNLISKLVTVLVLFVGATFVMQAELSVGQLVAFSMLATAFNTPVIRLSQLWQELQQVRISISRLGDILNHEDEGAKSDRHWLKTVTGNIEISKLSFKYQPSRPYSLNDVDLCIKPGEVIGLVGRSGSGKSTLTKLIQGLYEPESGSIKVDGHDLKTIDMSSLRSHIGVVLQENVLFSDTIFNNISFAAPNLTLEQVQKAAMLAGAHEFICSLPDGYQTVLEERGADLSGGQRQRIAIARALAIDPKILIFDEATSALDYESERQLQNNLAHICSDRTVIIVAHRLSTIRHADKIIVLDKGSIIEQGNHEQLARQGGMYANLCAQQAL